MEIVAIQQKNSKQDFKAYLRNLQNKYKDSTGNSIIDIVETNRGSYTEHTVKVKENNWKINPTPSFTYRDKPYDKKIQIKGEGNQWTELNERTFTSCDETLSGQLESQSAVQGFIGNWPT